MEGMDPSARRRCLEIGSTAVNCAQAHPLPQSLDRSEELRLDQFNLTPFVRTEVVERLGHGPARDIP